MFVLLTGRYDNVMYDQTEETLPARTDTRPFNAFTPKLALNYKLTPAIALYTSYGLSFDAPAANEMASADPAYLFNQDLNAQKSKNFEIGIKGNVFRWDKLFLKRLNFEATLFNIRIGNEIIPFEVLGDVFYRNAAKTNRRGAELGVQLEIYKGLNFGVTYTYSDFQYLTYEAETIEEDSLGNLITSTKDFSGNTVPSVPKNNLYLSLAYARSLGKHVNVFAKASYQGISGMWVDDENTDKTKAYNLLNGLLGVDLKFGKFNIMASGGVNNIFNEIYVGFTNTNSADKRFYEAGAPRDYYVSINFGYTF
jgi:iron complex outermembrane receptor protein